MGRLEAVLAEGSVLLDGTGGPARPGWSPGSSGRRPPLSAATSSSAGGGGGRGGGGESGSEEEAEAGAGYVDDDFEALSSGDDADGPARRPASSRPSRGPHLGNDCEI